jgi:hypothetical protein
MSLLSRLSRIVTNPKKGLLGGLDPNARQPVFYSALDEAIRMHPMKEASGEQWLGTIKNLPGVKAEEVKWSGVEDFLANKTGSSRDNGGPITRDELLSYMSDATERYAPDEFYMTSRGDYVDEEDWLYQNEDAISERTYERISNDWHHDRALDESPEFLLDEVNKIPRSSAQIGKELDDARRVVEKSLNSVYGDASVGPWDVDRMHALEKEFQQAVERESRDQLTPDMFTGERLIDKPATPAWQVSIKGGYTNEDRVLDDVFDTEEDAYDAGMGWVEDWRRNDGWEAFEQNAMDDGSYRDDIINEMKEYDEPNFGVAYKDYSLKDGKNYEELLFTLPNLGADSPGTHWDDYVDDPVVAHVRFDTRKSSDGKKVLAIQEVQSDWHQQGREKGYQGQHPQEAIDAASEKYNALQGEFIGIRQDQRDAVKSLSDSALQKVADMQGMDPYFSVNAIKYLRTGYVDPALHGHGIRQRADQIADSLIESPSYWGPVVDESPDTIKVLQTLKQEAERARLASEEARIALRSMEDGIPDAPFKNNIWASMVMKRMARYAADNGYDEIAWSGKIKNGSVRSGQEGSDFYDKILVNEMNKLGKSSKAQVGKSNISGFEWNSIAMTPEFKEFLKKGLPLFMWPLFAGGTAGGLLARGGKKETA